MKYLADTSALVRMMRGQVDPRWDETVARGLVAVCEPVLTETLTIANAKSYEEVEQSILDVYPWIPVPDDAWELIRRVRHDLAERSAHQGLSVADYLVVATALGSKLTLLHEDGDFETVAHVVEQLEVVRITAAPKP